MRRPLLSRLFAASVAGWLVCAGLVDSQMSTAVTLPPGATPVQVTPPVVKVTTIPLAGVPRLSAGLIGGSHHWLDDAGGVLNPDGTLNASILTLSKRLGLRSVRYPGGTVANLFSWRHDDTSPGCQTSGGYAAEAFAPISASRSRYTIAKHAHFLSAVSARTNLMIPMINTSPREARQFVLSVVRHTGARQLTVEVGNEPMYRKQHYWRSAHSIERRRTQYIDGGRRTEGPGNVVLVRDAGYNGLFHLRGCDLRHPVRANGAANQVYRTRYVPISTRMTPQIRIHGRPWRYVKSLRNAGSRHVFTITHGGTRIRFGDGRGNGAKPEGRMRIGPNHPYVAVRQPGFRDFYRALKRLVGTSGITKINVCSGWTFRGFVNAMDARGARYDCLAAHLPATFLGVHTAPAANITLQRHAARLNSRLLSWRRAARDSPVAGAHRRFVIVTEYGVARTSYAGLGRKLVSTMYRDRLLMGQMRAGVRIGNIYGFNLFWQTGTNSAGDKLYALSSTARMLSLWRRMTGRQPVRVRCSGCTVPGNVKIVATRTGHTATLMMLNIGADSSNTWRPTFAVANRGGDSCITVRRMRAGLDATDLPTRTGGPVPSMRPVLVQRWPAGTAFPNDTGVRSIFAHSIELMTISPTTSGCSTPKF
jgi:hypothetical protein